MEMKRLARYASIGVSLVKEGIDEFDVFKQVLLESSNFRKTFRVCFLGDECSKLCQQRLDQRRY